MAMKIKKDNAELDIEYKPSLPSYLWVALIGSFLAILLPLVVYLGPKGGIAGSVCVLSLLVLFSIFYFGVLPKTRIRISKVDGKIRLKSKTLFGTYEGSFEIRDVKEIAIKEYKKEEVYTKIGDLKNRVFYYLLFLLKNGKVASLYISGERSMNFPIKNKESERLAEEISKFLSLPYTYADFEKEHPLKNFPRPKKLVEIKELKIK